MSGTYLDLMSPAAFRELLGTFPALGPETVTTDKALGRYLLNDLQSPEDLPAYPRSSMDGYAVRAADCFGATETNPTYLSLAIDLDITTVSEHHLAPGQCARVVTGSSLPPGADAVIMVEHTQELGEGTIEIRKSAAPGDNMQMAGEDVQAGETALKAGVVLRPVEIGLLAALGLTRVEVRRCPKAAVISTGDELVPQEAKPGPGHIRDLNAPALRDLIRQAGAEPVMLGIVPDQVRAIARAMAQALEVSDAVFVSGGSSVGHSDFTLRAIKELPRAEILAHGLAVKPGKPTILARVGRKAVWGLPGQAASAQVVMFVFGRPFLAHLAGDPQAFDQPRPGFPAFLSRNLASCHGRDDYVRVRLTRPQGRQLLATPILGQSGLLKTLIKAQGLICIPAELEGLEAGTPVFVEPL